MTVLAAASMLLAGCMTLDQDREAQRPRLPENQAVLWAPTNRLYRSVVVDYVTGMDQHSYLFGSANQSAFRPLLEQALEETDLLAPTPAAARYALQIEFKDLEGTPVGTDFTATSDVLYRMVDRASGQTVFQSEVPASFNAQFRGLNEDDAALAYSLSVPLLADAGVVSAKAKLGVAAFGHDYLTRSELHNLWHGMRIASTYSALFGPAVVTAEMVNPFDYWAMPNFNGTPPSSDVLGARKGVLSTEGVGARFGLERRRQADFMMMGQSLTKFVIALSDSEHVPMTTVVPCVDNAEVQQIKLDLDSRGLPWRTDDCMAYQRPYSPGGRTFTPYRY